MTTKGRDRRSAVASVVRPFPLGVVTAALAALLSVLPAQAGMIDESSLQPWENCALCHSLDGVSRMAKFPKLAGQVPAYIEKQIRDFRAARRTNDGEQMQGMARLIAEKDIPVVAKYFGTLPPPPPADPPPDDAHATGQTLFHQGDAARGLPACVSCHGKSNTAASGAPRLESQHADYVIKQLTDFRSGDRANDPDGVMAGVAAKLSDADIRAVGGYLAAEPRH